MSDASESTVRLAYEQHGPDDGPVLVLLHAFPFDHRMWDGVVAAISDQVRLVLVDLPGLGRSPLPAGTPSLGHSADGVADAMDRAGIASAVVAGVSMGGYVAMEMVRRHRARLSGLALIDTKASADDEQGKSNRLRMAEAVVGPQGAAVLEAMLPNMLSPDTLAKRPDVVH